MARDRERDTRDTSPPPLDTDQPGEAAQELLQVLVRSGQDAEVFLRRGRSRRLRFDRGRPGAAVVDGAGGAAATADHLTTSTTFEEGWAVRAGDRRGSFFAAGTGKPSPTGPWPAAQGPPLRLPVVTPAPAWVAPPELEQSLLGEGEVRSLFEAIDRALAAEIQGARVRSATLEEGTSDSEILSNRGARARWRSRVATLVVEAEVRGPAGEADSGGLEEERADPDSPFDSGDETAGERAGDGAISAPSAVARLPGGTLVRLEFAERLANRLQPKSIARRLADRLHVEREGTPAATGLPPLDRDRGEFLLAPAVAARLLAALSPLWVGPRAPARIEPLRDRRGRVTAETVTLVDHGRLPDGLLAAPVDGEGVATRETVIIEDGVFRQPLLAWWQARPPFDRFAGCSRRDSWREPPTPGPTHLYIRPRRDTSVAMLLGGVARGYYLLDVLGAVRFDAEGDRFRVPVCGYAVQSGRATHPVASAWLHGSVATLLHNVLGVGRDVLFFPGDGMVGSPSLLVGGLELRGR